MNHELFSLVYCLFHGLTEFGILGILVAIDWIYTEYRHTSIHESQSLSYIYISKYDYTWVSEVDFPYALELINHISQI